MYRSLVVCFALVLAATPVQAQGRTFSFSHQTPISIIVETFGKLGDFNVVVSAGVRGAATLEYVDTPPVEALERFAKEQALHVMKVPYVERPTYIVSDQPLDAEKMVMTPGSPDGDPRNFEFRRPTPVSTILRTFAMLGGVQARWEGAEPPAMTASMQMVSGVEAIHVLAHALGAEVSLDGNVFVVRPGPGTPGGGQTPAEAQTTELE